MMPRSASWSAASAVLGTGADRCTGMAADLTRHQMTRFLNKARLGDSRHWTLRQAISFGWNESRLIFVCGVNHKAEIALQYAYEGGLLCFCRKRSLHCSFRSSFALVVANKSSAQDSQIMSGEVTNVDFSSGMITIRHNPNGPLNLGQSTDKFRAAEPIMLNALRPGVEVKFAATRIGGELSITRILTE